MSSPVPIAPPWAAASGARSRTARVSRCSVRRDDFFMAQSPGSVDGKCAEPRPPREAGRTLRHGSNCRSPSRDAAPVGSPDFAQTKDTLGSARPLASLGLTRALSEVEGRVFGRLVGVLSWWRGEETPRRPAPGSVVVAGRRDAPTASTRFCRGGWERRRPDGQHPVLSWWRTGASLRQFREATCEEAAFRFQAGEVEGFPVGGCRFI